MIAWPVGIVADAPTFKIGIWIRRTCKPNFGSFTTKPMTCVVTCDVTACCVVDLNSRSWVIYFYHYILPWRWRRSTQSMRHNISEDSNLGSPPLKPQISQDWWKYLQETKGNLLALFFMLAFRKGTGAKTNSRAQGNDIWYRDAHGMCVAGT